MKKTLFTTALACVLAIGSLTASAKIFDPQEKVTFNSNNTLSVKGSESLKILMAVSVNPDKEVSLSQFLTTAPVIPQEGGDLYFGYKVGDGENSKFVLLSQSMIDIAKKTADKAQVATLSLGEFKSGETIEFGYAADSQGNKFRATPVSLVEDKSDALFHAGYDQESFFKLDFSKDPFNGNIDVLVMGEPLPPATVTLLVALAAAAAFLLYNSKRQARSAEQA